MLHELHAMINKKPKKPQLINKFLLYSATLLLITCSVLFLFMLASSIPSLKLFFFVSVQNMESIMLSSKAVFIVGNLIMMIILIGESKFFCSNYSAPASEVYYNEYINQKRSLQGSSSPVPDEKRERKMDGGTVRRSEVGGDGSLAVDEGKEELDREDELSLPTEELKKRADEFIARVNRQRRLEARLQLCY